MFFRYIVYKGQMIRQNREIRLLRQATLKNQILWFLPLQVVTRTNFLTRLLCVFRQVMKFISLSHTINIFFRFLFSYVKNRKPFLGLIQNFLRVLNQKVRCLLLLVYRHLLRQLWNEQHLLVHHLLYVSSFWLRFEFFSIWRNWLTCYFRALYKFIASSNWHTFTNSLQTTSDPRKRMSFVLNLLRKKKTLLCWMDIIFLFQYPITNFWSLFDSTRLHQKLLEIQYNHLNITTLTKR